MWKRLLLFLAIPFGLAYPMPGYSGEVVTSKEGSVEGSAESSAENSTEGSAEGFANSSEESPV